MNINTDFLSLNHPKAIAQAVKIIQGGGVVAFPTDTVYGIGVSAFHHEAIDKIFQVKERSQVKAIPILIADVEDLKEISSHTTPETIKIINHFWPGALTIVVQKSPKLPINISPEDTIGVRIPDHNLIRELIRKAGPLAATSANLSGSPSALTAMEALEQLEGRIDLVLDGGPSLGGQASTVVDLTTEEPLILREGSITLQDIKDQIDIED
jgi:L-threonylcarbamoyladenylate synthase